MIRIPGAAALVGRTFDLVLLCEVLEHLSDPSGTLVGVAAHVRPGGLLYVTVPNREFPLGDIPAGGWYPAYLQLILRNRWTTLAADFWSTGVRAKLGRVPPLGFVKMHEHINFFDPASLSVMLRRAQLDVLACEPYGKGGLVALGRRLS
jgi:SAM-dependent methyltransferase